MEVLAWPAAVVMLGTLALLLFRKPLARFLDRADKISPRGIEASTAKQGSAKEVGPSPADEFMQLFDNALLVAREQWLRGELQRIIGTDQTQRDKILIRIIAAQSIVQQFENTYRTIWGSQLTALELANTAGAEGIELQFFETLYNQAAPRDPLLYERYSFDGWMGFMEGSRLVMKKDGKVGITLEGREFLKYLVHQGYSLYKLG